MTRPLIWALIAYYLLTGLYIAILPNDFYLNAPGVLETGPYNMHFIRDVGFAFFCSAVAMGYGLYYANKPVMMFGALWLLMHGIFHLTLWLLHGMHIDSAAVTDLVLVSVPAVATFVLCARHRVS